MQKLLPYSMLLLGISFFGNAQARSNHSISSTAANYRDYLEGDKLYGKTYRNATTQNGRLACARVVQIVLNKAGVPGFSSPLYGVRQIQNKTRGWKTISYDDIQAGDVIFWHKTGQDEVCSGGGDCHVGIAVSSGSSFDNSGISGRPRIAGIGYRLRWRFMYAKRKY